MWELQAMMPGVPILGHGRVGLKTQNWIWIPRQNKCVFVYFVFLLPLLPFRHYYWIRIWRKCVARVFKTELSCWWVNLQKDENKKQTSLSFVFLFPFFSYLNFVKFSDLLIYAQLYQSITPQYVAAHVLPLKEVLVSCWNGGPTFIDWKWYPVFQTNRNFACLV